MQVLVCRQQTEHRMLKNNDFLSPIKSGFFLLVLLLLTGCGSFENLITVPTEKGLTDIKAYNTKLHKESVYYFDPIRLDSRVSKLRLEPRADHLFFVIDQSSALSKDLDGVDMRLYAREIVRRFVRTLPEQTYSGAILTNTQKPSSYAQRLRLMNFTSNDIEHALGRAASEKNTKEIPLEEVVIQLSHLINQVNGISAVILVTSWSEIDKSLERAVIQMRQSNRFVESASVINPAAPSGTSQEHLSGVCLYTVGVGNRLSRTRLDTVDSCGYSVAADSVSQPRDMAHFVQKILYKGPADTDGDGIYDYRDRCLNTHAGRIVDYSGCPRFANSNLGVSND
jgi:OOP family OmpA-OmpF porin